MSESFTVDLELLTALVDRMSTVGAHLVTVEDEIDTRVLRLHATWQGDAATMQADAHHKWRAGAQQMREALDTLREIARTADANYTAAVDANRRMWAM